MYPKSLDLNNLKNGKNLQQNLVLTKTFLEIPTLNLSKLHKIKQLQPQTNLAYSPVYKHLNLLCFFQIHKRMLSRQLFLRLPRRNFVTQSTSHKNSFFTKRKVGVLVGGGTLLSLSFVAVEDVRANLGAIWRFLRYFHRC